MDASASGAERLVGADRPTFRAPATTVERERVALEIVYRPDELDEIEHVDRPDFVARIGDFPAFGIEVTDLFRSEADARAEFLPTYVADLLAGGRHRHRDDEEILSISTFTIRDKNGNLKQEDLPGIIQAQPTYEERGHLLAAAITRKTAAAAGYRDDLAHLNLIVVDWTRVGPAPGEAYAADDILTPAVRQALRASPFREIFLIGEATDGACFYRPLRVLALMDSFFLFVRAMEAFDQGHFVSTHEAMIRLYVRVMTRNGEPTYLGRHGSALTAVHVSASVWIDGGMQILDHRDRPLPAPEVAGAADHADFPVDAFAAHLAQFRTDNRFENAMHVAAAAPRHLARASQQQFKTVHLRPDP